TNTGFQELSIVLIRNMYEINHISKSLKTDYKVDVIQRCGEFRSFGGQHGDVEYRAEDIRFWMSTVTNRFSGGPDNNHLDSLYHRSELLEKLEELKNPNILKSCFGMFFVGSVAEIVAFFLEFFETKDDCL